MAAKIEYTVERWDSQTDGMAIVGGFRVVGTVTGVTGKKFASLTIGTFGDEADAEEVAELLNEKHEDQA